MRNLFGEIILNGLWVTLSEFFLQSIRIVRIQDLTVESKKKIFSFWSLTYIPISTYLRPNIHQNGPDILGVKTKVSSKGKDITFKYTICRNILGMPSQLSKHLCYHKI
jgi:hypothetical protein